MTAAPTPASAACEARWQPLAAVAAWLVPGLGHALLGQRRRGLIIGLVVLGLWLAGLLVGGISIIDHRHSGDGERERLSFWFVGQAMLGPSVVVDMAHQYLKAQSFRRFGHAPDPGDEPRPVYTPALGRVAEIGILYTAMAGLLNLLAILDVAWRPALAREGHSKDDVHSIGAPTA